MAAGQMKVGFIGIGTMGLPMASNLLAKGYQVVAYDINAAALGAIVAKGAVAATSCQAVAATSQYVITMLPASVHVEAATLGPAGVFAGLAAGGTLIEMSTIDPGTSRKVAAAGATKGLRVVDAPVSGAPPKAIDATLTIMVGGEAAVFADVKPILSALGSNVIHVGPAGAGQTVKLVNNLIAATCMASVAECFNVGVKAGIDPKTLYDVVSKSSGDNWTLRTRVPYPGVVEASPANADFAPGFMTDLMVKDVGLAVDLAKAVQAPVLVGGVAQQLYTAAQAQGHGRADFSSVVKVIQSLSNG